MINTSIKIKHIFAEILEFSGFTKIYISGKWARSYLILMYHRIIPKKELEPGMQEGMYVEPETFKMHICCLKKYFNIIPLSEIFCTMEDLSSLNNSPICALTFDDGWYDFYKFAYPIISSQKVPATVFLPTKYIGTVNRFWTDHVTNIFVKRNNQTHTNNKIGSNHMIINKLLSLEGTTEYKIENAISILKEYREDDIFNILNELENIWGLEVNLNGRAFLNWEEVGKMAESGLITFGSHTNKHSILTHLHDNEIIEELIQSKAKLLSEGVVKKSFIPFSYPNGNHDSRVEKMVEEAGYALAVTTERGWNPRGASPFTLRRVGIHQDISSTKEIFRCRIANLF